MGSPIEKPVRHAQRVYWVTQGKVPAGRIEEVSSSWQRSANEFGVDPGSSEAPRVLTSYELRPLREPLDRLIVSAQEEIDRLYKVVGRQGTPCSFVTRQASRSNIAATKPTPAGSSTGEPGSVVSGRKLPKAPTASAPASPKSGPS